MADDLQAIEIEVTSEESGAGEPAAADKKPAAGAPPEEKQAQTPAAPEHVPPEKVPAQPESDDPQKGIEELKQRLQSRAEEAERQTRQSEQQRQEETRRREQAEQIAREATAVAEQARKDAVRRELESVSSALTSVENERNALKATLKEALEKGEFANAAEIQSQIGEASGRIVILREGKTQLEQRQQAAPAAVPTPTESATVERTRQQAAPQQPQLDYAQPWSEDQWRFYLGTRTVKTAEWLRQHPEFATNPEARERIMGLHQYATLSKRITPDTDAYFTLLDNELKPPKVEKTEEKPRAATPKPPPPAAPPSREPPGSNGGAQRVTLSVKERETARLLFPDKSEAEAEMTYARNKLALMQEGKIGRA